jgi:tetratricopeptide (TPR) repeat protein
MNPPQRLNTVHAITHYNRGNKKLGLGNNSEAIEQYNYAIEDNPNFVEAYNNRGTAKAKAGDMVGAISDYNRAIELDPQLSSAHINRVKAKFELRGQ